MVGDSDFEMQQNLGERAMNADAHPSLTAHIDDLETQVEATRAELCQTVGAMENIFNGVTAEGVPTNPILVKVADIASSLLVDPKGCEHKAPNGELVAALREEGHGGEGIGEWCPGADPPYKLRDCPGCKALRRRS